MNNSTLIERYVYATIRRLPRVVREDVKKELEVLISDMLEERCGDITPAEKDIKVVLAELGTPSELANQYSPDSQKSLISGEYFMLYKLVIKIVGLSVLGAMTISFFILGIVDQSKTPIEWFLVYFSSVVQSTFGWFTGITLLFAFFEHEEVKINGDSIDKLPPVPEKKEKIPVIEPIIGIVISLVFTTIFLLSPQTFGWAFLNGEFVPLFNASQISQWWEILISLALLGIIRECIKLLDGRYTVRLLVTSLVVNVLSSILVMIWLTNTNLINPQFVQAITTMFTDAEFTAIKPIFNNFQRVFLGVWLFSLLIDSINVTVKTLKYSSVGDRVERNSD